MISDLVFATVILQFLFNFYPKFQASSFFSVTVQTGLCRPLSESIIVGFLMQRLIPYCFQVPRQLQNKLLSVSTFVTFTHMRSVRQPGLEIRRTFCSIKLHAVRLAIKSDSIGGVSRKVVEPLGHRGGDNQVVTGKFLQ